MNMSLHEKLKGKIPDSVYNELPEVMDKFKIDSLLGLAHFLGQCAHESGDFKVKEENLNYSSKSLLKVFGKYFTEEQALEYERKPEKIGSRVYANRMGNGDESSGEGYKFRGRGFIQLTGKNNYEKFGDIIDENLIEKPSLVVTDFPLSSAGWFFCVNGLLKICDEGIGEDVILKVTKKVNGGTNGLEERKLKTKKFYDILK